MSFRINNFQKALAASNISNIRHGYTSDEAVGNNDFLRIMIEPDCGLDPHIPDLALNQRIPKTILYSNTLTSAFPPAGNISPTVSDILLHFTPQTKSTKSVISQYANYGTTLDPRWIYCGGFLPEQDIAENFSQARFVSSLLTVTSSTIGAGAFAVQGQIYAVSYNDPINPYHLTGVQLVAGRKDELSFVENHILADGVAITADPPLDPTFLPMNTNAITNHGAAFEVMYSNYNSTKMASFLPKIVTTPGLAIDSIEPTINLGFFPNGAITTTFTGTIWGAAVANQNVWIATGTAPYGSGTFDTAGGGVGNYSSSLPFPLRGDTRIRVDITSYYLFSVATFKQFELWIGYADGSIKKVGGEYYTASTAQEVHQAVIEVLVSSFAPIVCMRIVSLGNGNQITNTDDTNTSISITIHNDDYLRPGEVANGSYVMINGLPPPTSTTPQMVTVNAVVNYEAVPNANLAKNITTKLPLVDFVQDIEAAKLVFANKPYFNIRSVYKLSEYIDLKRRHAFNKMSSRDFIRAQAFDFGDIFSGAKKLLSGAMGFLAPSITNAVSNSPLSSFSPFVNPAIAELQSVLSADKPSRKHYNSNVPTHLTTQGGKLDKFARARCADDEYKFRVTDYTYPNSLNIITKSEQHMSTDQDYKTKDQQTEFNDDYIITLAMEYDILVKDINALFNVDEEGVSKPPSQQPPEDLVKYNQGQNLIAQWIDDHPLLTLKMDPDIDPHYIRGLMANMANPLDFKEKAKIVMSKQQHDTLFNAIPLPNEGKVSLPEQARIKKIDQLRYMMCTNKKFVSYAIEAGIIKMKPTLKQMPKNSKFCRAQCSDYVYIDDEEDEAGLFNDNNQENKYNTISDNYMESDSNWMDYLKVEKQEEIARTRYIYKSERRTHPPNVLVTVQRFPVVLDDDTGAMMHLLMTPKPFRNLPSDFLKPISYSKRSLPSGLDIYFSEQFGEIDDYMANIFADSPLSGEVFFTVNEPVALEGHSYYGALLMLVMGFPDIAPVSASIFQDNPDLPGIFSPIGKVMNKLQCIDKRTGPLIFSSTAEDMYKVPEDTQMIIIPAINFFNSTIMPSKGIMILTLTDLMYTNAILSNLKFSSAIKQTPMISKEKDLSALATARKEFTDLNLNPDIPIFSTLNNAITMLETKPVWSDSDKRKLSNVITAIRSYQSKKNKIKGPSGPTQEQPSSEQQERMALDFLDNTFPKFLDSFDKTNTQILRQYFSEKQFPKAEYDKVVKLYDKYLANPNYTFSSRELNLLSGVAQKAKGAMTLRSRVAPTDVSESHVDYIKQHIDMLEGTPSYSGEYQRFQQIETQGIKSQKDKNFVKQMYDKLHAATERGFPRKKPKNKKQINI